MSLTAERLRELVDYDPETGVFTWRKRRGGSARVGSVAGAASDGNRIIISIYGIRHKAHRLAWLWMKGEWPECEIDHRDSDASNNRWLNLRLANRNQNQWNVGKIRSNSTGYKGVCFRKDTSKFTAYIEAYKRRRYLGCFDAAELAHAAYCNAAKVLHGDFARII